MSESEDSSELDADAPHFPVFARVLKKYFPNRVSDLLDKYHSVGEDSIEFKGLSNELVAAINTPSEAATFLNEMLGTELTADEAEEHLIEMHDQLTQSGEFSPEHVEAEKERLEAQKPSTDELLDYYLKRRITFPGVFARLSAPLWVYPSISIPVAILGSLVIMLVPGNSAAAPILHGLAVAIISAAALITFVSVLVMYSLRSERLNPEKERQREEAFRKSKEAKSEKPRAALMDRLNPFNR